MSYNRKIESDREAMREHDKTQKANAAARRKHNAEKRAKSQ